VWWVRLDAAFGQGLMDRGSTPPSSRIRMFDVLSVHRCLSTVANRSCESAMIF
jgi:hypothetical protein